MDGILQDDFFGELFGEYSTGVAGANWKFGEVWFLVNEVWFLENKCSCLVFFVESNPVDLVDPV